jgi:hypothetical protein
MSAVIERPVFIVSAPRACSTLLFETLVQAPTLWSIGDESHRLIESHPKLSPGRGFTDSNRLTADLLDPRLAESLRAAFLRQLRDRDGAPAIGSGETRFRLLEKTPKNALRIPFLHALFPDARFVFLHREARENIGSIIDAWGSGRFVTYRRIVTAHGPWSLLLPPGWRDFLQRPLAEIAAFQWASANHLLMQDLAALPAERWCTVSAGELREDAPRTVRRLCAFMDIVVDERFADYLVRPLPPSRYTLSAPGVEKWQRHAGMIEAVLPRIAPVVAALERFVARDGQASPTGGGHETRD